MAKTCTWILMIPSYFDRTALGRSGESMRIRMKIVLTLWAKDMLREPLAIHKNRGGSRIPKTLNLLHCFGTPVTGGMISQAQVTGSRKVRYNMQQFKALWDAP